MLPSFANAVPATRTEKARIADDSRAYLPRLLDGDDAEVARRCEHMIRNLDPCIRCATHFPKLRIDRETAGP
jgi:coenzyme F420-reducing hydrogenase alpha subunit